MRIAITGASGFVGRVLCRHLTERGHEVVAIVRRLVAAPSYVQEIHIVEDYSAKAVLSSALTGCDVVVHLAGRAHMLHDTADDPLQAFRDVNVGISEKLALAATAANVRRFVFVSSIGVNGNSTAGRPFTEADIPAPHDLYAISKWEAEQHVISVSEAAGMDYVIARPVLMFGPDAPGNFALLLKLASNRVPLPFGMLRKRRSLLSVWNFADFLRACAEYGNPISETFVVADPESVTLPDIFAYLSEGMGTRQRLLPVPRMLLAASCGMLGKGNMLRKIDSELLVSPRKAMELLDWRPPYSTRVALTRTGAEYRMDKS